MRGTLWAVTDAGEPFASEDAAGPEALPLDAIEQDLDNADKALAALDAGDLNAAEALAARLDSAGAPTSDGDLRGGDEQEQAVPSG